jgi:lipoprotein-releasing system permease protein
MSFRFLIARRYLQFRRQQGKRNFLSFLTVIAILGITLGVTALLLALTILGGFEREIKEKVLAFVTHIQVIAFQNKTFPEYQQASEKMKSAFPEIVSVAPFVAKEGMVKFNDRIEGIYVKGIEPGSENSAKNYLIEGMDDLRPVSEEYHSCVVGQKLIRKLDARLGDTLIVFGLNAVQGSIRQPRIVPFIIRGIYESGMSEYDDIYFFTDLASAQTLFMIGSTATGFEIMLRDASAAVDVSEKIMDTMGYPYFARTHTQLYRNLYTWIELQKKPTPIILGLIIIVATVNIIGTLLMMVMEKTKQIGILKSMGSSNADIRSIFLFEGLLIGIIGTLLGNIVSLLLSWLQWEFKIISLPSSIYFMTSVPILFRWESFVVVSALTIILSLAASYIPATLASRFDPIRSIRFQ